MKVSEFIREIAAIPSDPEAVGAISSVGIHQAQDDLIFWFNGISEDCSVSEYLEPFSAYIKALRRPITKASRSLQDLEWADGYGIALDKATTILNTEVLTSTKATPPTYKYQFMVRSSELCTGFSPKVTIYASAYSEALEKIINMFANIEMSYKPQLQSVEQVDSAS